MLRDRDAMPTVAVTDLAVARRFYRESLGLEELSTTPEMGVALFRTGRSTLLVYKSEFAGTNRATSVTWGVGDDFDAIVAALHEADVTFEHYDIPGMARSGDVYRSGDFKAAWFTDPDGNILHINNQ